MIFFISHSFYRTNFQPARPLHILMVRRRRNRWPKRTFGDRDEAYFFNPITPFKYHCLNDFPTLGNTITVAIIHTHPLPLFLWQRRSHSQQPIFDNRLPMPKRNRCLALNGGKKNNTTRNQKPSFMYGQMARQQQHSFHPSEYLFCAQCSFLFFYYFVVDVTPSRLKRTTRKMTTTMPHRPNNDDISRFLVSLKWR